MAAVAAAVVVGEAVGDVAAEVAVAVVRFPVSAARRLCANIYQTGLAAIPRRYAIAAGECVETRPTFTVRRRPSTQKQQGPDIHGIGVLT